jgi:uncharacterized lipoprotein NlpE involved in copper resistance
MKNVINLFGIIALVAVIGFFFVGCDATPDTATVNLHNQYSLAITRIQIGEINNPLYINDDLYLAPGASRSFTLELGNRDGETLFVYLTFEGYLGAQASKQYTFTKGSNISVTLNASGKIN